MKIAKIIDSDNYIISYLLKNNSELILNDFECINCKVRLYPKSYRDNNVPPYFSLSRGSKHFKKNCKSISVKAYEQAIETSKFCPTNITKPAVPNKLILSGFKQAKNNIEDLDTKLTLPAKTIMTKLSNGGNGDARGAYTSSSFKKICLSYINDYNEVKNKEIEIVGIGIYSYDGLFKYVCNNKSLQTHVFFGLIKLEQTLRHLELVDINSTILEIFLLYGTKEFRLQITLEQDFSTKFIKKLKTKIENKINNKNKTILLCFIGKMTDYNESRNQYQ